MSAEGRGGWPGRHSDAVAWVLTALTGVMTLVMFNARLSQSGDDSAYICRALDFLHEGRYPSFQGPLYPLFLSVAIALKGSVNVLQLKLTSAVLIVLCQVVFYRSLRGRVEPWLLLSSMLLMSVNSWFVEFGGQTFSEALFMVLEWVFVGLALRLEETEVSSRRRLVVLSSLTGLSVVLCALTRTVGFGLALSAVAYLLLRGRKVHALSVLAAVGLWWGAWMGVRALAWGDKASSGGQMQTLLQVDPYAADEGLETPSGYVGRFLTNSDLYLSKHIVKMLGFRDPESRSTTPLVAVALYALFLWGGYCGYRKSRAVLFMACCAAVMMGVTFFALQTLWDQYRLIVPYVAMAFVVLLYGLKELAGRLSPSFGAKGVAAAVVLMAVAGVVRSFQRADLMALRRNMSGDLLYGYTDDWYNYLSMCSVVGRELPPSDYVACRKPNMACIYSGGRKFYGIYNIPSEDPDVLADNLRERGVTHVIVASLRRDPMDPNGGVINTVHRYLAFIINKYPDFLEAVAVCGQQGREEATLVRLRYDKIDESRRQAHQEDQ